MGAGAEGSFPPLSLSIFSRKALASSMDPNSLSAKSRPRSWLTFSIARGSPKGMRGAASCWLSSRRFFWERFLPPRLFPLAIALNTSLEREPLISHTLLPLRVLFEGGSLSSVVASLGPKLVAASPRRPGEHLLFSGRPRYREQVEQAPDLRHRQG